MAKNPAFPFYAQDFLVDTLRWDRLMKSLHVDLICESWINGGLKNDKGFPVGLSSEDRIIWKRIKDKWVLKNSMWYNEKLEETRSAREKFIANQAEKGKKSAEARKKTVEPVSDPGVCSGSTVVEPLEKEIEKENILIVKESEKKEITHLLFADELYIETLQMTHRGKNISQAWDECYIHFSNAPRPPNTVGEWKQKLNTWLSNTKIVKANASTKNKSTDHINSLVEGFKRRHGGNAAGG